MNGANERKASTESVPLQSVVPRYSNLMVICDRIDNAELACLHIYIYIYSLLCFSRLIPHCLYDFFLRGTQVNRQLHCQLIFNMLK